MAEPDSAASIARSNADRQVSAGVRCSQDVLLADLEADHGFDVKPAAWKRGIHGYEGEITRVEMSWEDFHQLARLWALTSHVVNPKTEDDDDD